MHVINYEIGDGYITLPSHVVCLVRDFSNKFHEQLPAQLYAIFKTIRTLSNLFIIISIALYFCPHSSLGTSVN